MEVLTENEVVEVQSPRDRCRDLLGGQTGRIGFLRQRSFLLENPDLLQYAEFARARGWAHPLRFAIQGLLIAAILISALSWLITSGEGTSADQIAAVRAQMESEIKTEQAAIDAAEFDRSRVEKSGRNDRFIVASSGNLTRAEALTQLDALVEEAHKQQEEYRYNAEIKMQNLRAAGDAFDLAASGTPVMLTLALLFAAPIFRNFVRNSYPRYRLAGQADNYWLYYLVSRGLWLNFALIVLLHIFLSRTAYGLAGFFDGIGPIGRIIFWLGLYALLLYWFFLVSKDLYKAMDLPAPAEYASPDNKLLLYLHNSFWLVFLVFESALALLAFGVYLMAKAG